MPQADPRPLIAHVIYHLGVGGLENGVVNLINHLPADKYRHALVCFAGADAGFARRIRRDDVTIHDVHKQPGHDLGASWRLYRLFRQIRPAIVHTRNLGTLEAQVPAWLAGVPARLHGEHGWDTFDPHGEHRGYQRLRRLHSPLIQRFVPLSGELEAYLIERVGIPRDKITRIYNGVDVARFQPAAGHGADGALPAGFAADDSIVMGTVGRMHGVKDQLNLARAFIALQSLLPENAARLRLVMVGEGPLRGECQTLLTEAGLASQVWLPGARDDVPALLGALDLFVLPSRAEGISNTILEAMASGLPVVATAVGGNPELVADGETGTLVPASDPSALAAALAGYVTDLARLHSEGEAARTRVEQQFSLDAMLARYGRLYDEALQRAGVS